MDNEQVLKYITNVIENIPTEWLTKTTHRLDIFNESKAKVEFLEQFEILLRNNNASGEALSKLPTAFDYIRLGHPLSCILEWVIANTNNKKSEEVISFSSQAMPILAILRKNSLSNRKTKIIYTNKMPKYFDEQVLKNIYGYNFDLVKVDNLSNVPNFDGSTIAISNSDEPTDLNIDFNIKVYPNLGSVVVVSGSNSESYISEIQHVRRRETIAMTPPDCLSVLKAMTNGAEGPSVNDSADNKSKVIKSIQEITGVNTKPLVGTSGLSVQYAILMGLVQHAKTTYTGKEIKIIVPPNCYGGTNDQSRRVAACIDGVDVVDLPVDGGSDMVQSVNTVLAEIAELDAVPFIVAEIPTNPRVEVPELVKLSEALSAERKTKAGDTATPPVFILDQTFCPNIHFLGDKEILANVQTIAYVSGSKFPSGGLCTSGYCVANSKAGHLIEVVESHLKLCDNEATDLQFEILANQMPSMNERINQAYKNTREFVNHIQEVLPEAKINFVSEELAEQSFTPSVFSLDLPTKGNNDQEKEAYKRQLNYKLINLMINEIPGESKHCVSYGQLKGCYWTIPATSTQGTTKERDKDYIVRVSMSGDMDIELHKKVFSDFVKSI